MSENSNTSWKCGGCGTWYSIYAVTKCECERVVTLQSGSTKGYDVLPFTDAKTYTTPAISGTLMNGETRSSCCVVGRNCALDVINSMIEAMETA